MVHFKIASTKQAEEISQLGSDTFTETFGTLFTDYNDVVEYCERTFSVAKIRQSLAKESNVFWIAYVDHIPVGYGKLKLNSASEFIDSDRICQLQKIYILAEYHSMKIGKGLQDMMFQKAKELKFDTIWLSVYIANVKAIRFYEKSGFQSAGEHSFAIGKDTFDFLALSKKL